MIEEKDQTYDFVCFTDLAYEFDTTQKKKIEQKIKRRLKYYKLGNYDQEKVEYIRQLKNELCSEISLNAKSRYYNKSQSEYASLADFDTEKMTADYALRYERVDRNELREMIYFAVNLYYMR